MSKLGRRDDFFSIGGNSLKCIQILARIKGAYGVEISVREFFAAPVIERLAARVEDALMALVKSMSSAEVERQLGAAHE